MADTKGMAIYALWGLAFLGFLGFIIAVVWPKIQEMKATTAAK